MRTFAQENPTANEAILGTRLRQLVKHFGLNVAVDQSDEIPAKPKIRQVGAKRGQDESETKKNKFPERQSVTADQAEEILSKQENLAKRPCAICAKYNPKFKGKHSAEKCWDNPANADKPRWWEQRNKKPRATERATVRSIRIGNGLKTEVEFIITPDIQEEAILGMDVLGKETGFAILPERERLKIGNLEWKLAKGRSGPEIRRIDTEDPLREEEAYGVPPYRETSDERLQIIWEELQIGSHPKSIRLSKSVEKKLRRLLKKYGHVFRDEVCPIEPRFGTHKIILKEGTHPRSIRQYRLKPKQREAVIMFVDKMKRAGLIRDAASPWNSPLLAVPKSDGTDRYASTPGN
eukprot:Stramenopile-MAST_4_protein_4225